MKTELNVYLGLAAAALLSGCGEPSPTTPTTPETPPATNSTSALPAGDSAPGVMAAATLAPASGSKVMGTVTFVRDGAKTRVEAHVTGLTPGAHGFHIHEKGDCSAADASSAGGHFNPTGASHGGPEDENRHVGDLGNLDADTTGAAHYSKTLDGIVFAGDASIVGKSLIVHGGEDDFKSQPSGNAGDRVACGVIEKR